MMRLFYLLCIAALVGCAPDPSPIPPQESAAQDTGQTEAEIQEVANLFSQAIATHDSTLAASVLSERVTILEGGNIESRHDYLSHHFHSDAAFIGAMQRDPLSAEITVSGSAAWMVSRSRLHGTFRDRDVDVNSLQTLILEQVDGTWQIVSVHWSSGRGG